MTHPPISINPERVKALLAAYGANPGAWPNTERGAALRLIEVSDKLQALQDETLRLDKMIGLQINTRFASDETNIPALSKRILNVLPVQASEKDSTRESSRKFSGWSGFLNFIPGSPRVWLGASATAVLASFMAIALLSTAVVPDPPTDALIVAADFDQWALVEVLDQPLDDGFGDGDSITVLGLL
ncbi:MAG TPA: hypothetical protein ENI80_00100 [Acidiferrobacteraceae bacterium]|nr:hypothetical protein [Acidiferrobacteraceae bacterium]